MPSQKHLLHHIKQDRLIFFSYDLVTVNDSSCDTLEKAKPDMNSSLQNIRKGNLNLKCLCKVKFSKEKMAIELFLQS